MLLSQLRPLAEQNSNASGESDRQAPENPFDPPANESIAVTDFDVITELSPLELEQLERKIQEDRIRRFAGSLDEAGLLELNRRVDLVQAQMATGTLPGFEGFSVDPPADGPYSKQATENLKQGVIVEMYLEQQFETDMARITEAMDPTEPQ